MRTTAILLAGTLAACGNKSKPSSTTTETSGGGGEEVEDTSGGDMIPPERMDEIKTALDRKRNAAARCLADAVNSGKAPKNAHGHVALEFTIGTSGHAEGIKVNESSIENPEVEQCVVDKVDQIDFGALQKPLEWSYTFAFESM